MDLDSGSIGHDGRGSAGYPGTRAGSVWTLIRAVQAVVRRMENCVQAEPVDLLGYQEYHRDLHKQIMVISGHRRLKKIAASIHNQVSRFSYKSLQNKEHLDSSVRYHRQILDAIKGRDSVRACKLMKEHVLKAIDAFRDEIHGL